MKIENIELNEKEIYFDNVTYIPPHAKGNAGHKDCKQGVIIGTRGGMVRVLYSESRVVQATNPDDLVWG